MHATTEPEAKKKHSTGKEIDGGIAKNSNNEARHSENLTTASRQRRHSPQPNTTMANDERFDFEAVLGTQAKDWACASDLQNLTRWYHPRPLLKNV